MVKKERLDKVLVARGLAASGSKARALIMEGRVVVGDHRADKAGFPVSPDAAIRIKPGRGEFVGRGGDKLSHALAAFDVEVRARICLDVGASTGGFTHCLLERGAAKVYAVDVGYGQMDPLVRGDPRVVVIERTNARYLSAREVGEPVSLITIDVSFISVLKILPALVGLAADDARCVILVKPQFELTPGRVGKGGVVRDRTGHRAALVAVAAGLGEIGLYPLDVTASPILGASGNREFFLLAGRTPPGLAPEALEERIAEAVG